MGGLLVARCAIDDARFQVKLCRGRRSGRARATYAITSSGRAARRAVPVNPAAASSRPTISAVSRFFSHGARRTGHRVRRLARCGTSRLRLRRTALRRRTRPPRPMQSRPASSSPSAVCRQPRRGEALERGGFAVRDARLLHRSTAGRAAARAARSRRRPRPHARAPTMWIRPYP